MQPSVFYFTRMLPAYRLPIIERLNERLDGGLVVCHGQPPKGNPVLMKDIKSSFKREVLDNHWYRDTTLHLQFYNKVFAKYASPSVVLAEESPRSVMLPFLLRKAKRLGAGRVLWGIFYSVHRPFSASYPLQRYRIAMANSVEACACYSRTSKNYLKPYVPEEKLFVAQNTMDSDTLFSCRKKLEAEGRRKVRIRLGIPADHHVFIFIAQLIKRKGTRELIETFARYRKKQPATLLVIGDGPEKEPMQNLTREFGLDGVRFLGSVPDLSASAPYLFASDLLLQPGYVGLVVNHAFMMGVPVITQEAPDGLPFHGPEVESIINGYNGIIVERNNHKQMQDSIEHILMNREMFSTQALEYAKKNLSTDRMIDSLLDAIEFAKSNRKH